MENDIGMQQGIVWKRQIPWRPALLFVLGAIFVTWFVWIPRTASFAAPNLTIEPVTWNVIGFDPGNSTAGPNVFPVAGRVCNSGDSAAINLSSTFIWDSENQWINLSGPANLTAPLLEAGQCIDFTYHVVVSRNASALNTARGYHISVTADDLGAINTPSQREIYVKPLSAQSELAVTSIVGPSALEVGETYQYTLIASMSGTNFGQLEHFIHFPNVAFRVSKIEAIYSNPPNATGDRIYADACGWGNIPGSQGYLECVGPPPSNFPGGLVSGTATVTYTVEVINTGTYTLTTGIYGYANNTFWYNADFGQDSLPVTSVQVIDEGAFLPIILKNLQSTLTATPTSTGPLPTPTSTGSITPNPGATKAVSPTEAGVGQNFTFTIRVLNNGSAPATSVVLEDSLSAYPYLDIFDLSTTKGTKNITGRVASVNIGSLNPGEVVTVRITIRVNSSAPATATACNIARISFGTSGSRSSNQQCFRVRGSPSLPPTGELSLALAKPNWPWTSLILDLCLGFAGLVLFRVGISIWRQKPHPARWLIAMGLTIFVIALASGLVSCGRSGSEKTPNVEANLTFQPMSTPIVTPSATTNPLAELPAYMFATPDPSEPSLIETLPSYPIPTPTLEEGRSAGTDTDTSAVVRMVIPKLNLDAKVAYVPFDGMSWMIQGLREEIAWLGDTSWPGLGGNTAFAGHVTVRGLGNGPFRYLNELAPGDEILVYTEKNLYTYQVRESSIVEETNMEVVQPSQGDQITLITCVDWNETIGIYLKRLVVFADKVQVSPLTY